MRSILTTKLKDEFNDILEVKGNWNYDKFLEKYKPSFDYSSEFLNLLYNETDYCLEIFNKYITEIIDKYIDDEIPLESLLEHKKWEFKCLNENRKKMYNKIFPNFIELLIMNVDLMDSEKKYVVVVKPKPKPEPESKLEPEIEFFDEELHNFSSLNLSTKKSSEQKIKIIEKDEETDEDQNSEVDGDKNITEDVEDEEIIENAKIINELELLRYDEKREPFDFRDNQKDAINKTIEQDFQSGIHCQIMGAGKTFTILNIAQQHYAKYQQNLIYIITTDRIDILKSWFMTDLISVIQLAYVKKHNVKIDNGTFKSKEYKDYEVRRLNDKIYYKEKDRDNYLTLNYDRFKRWTDDEIIDMSSFTITENIINKDKKRMEKLNGKLENPVLWICNNAFLKAGEKYKQLNLNNVGLVFVDECHSVSGKENCNMLEYLRNKGIKIQGFSATPLRPIKNAEDHLLKIYGTNPSDKKTNKVNIISNYDLIKALKDGIILPFIHTIITPVTDEKSLKINSSNKHELTLKKIIETYFINDTNLPYKKGVAWVNTIAKIAKDKGSYYKEIKSICDAKKIKLFVSYSGNKTYPEINELSKFEKCDSHALLLCVNRVKEGSDIKNLDCGIFLDAVKHRSIVSSLQSIGRIMRPDEAKKKKYAHIIESVKLDENKTIENLTVSTVLNYYKKILNISNITADIEYISKIQKLFDETRIVTRDGKKEVHIIIDEKKDIRCKINLDIKEIDWRVFQNSLRKELSNNSFKYPYS